MSGLIGAVVALAVAVPGPSYHPRHGICAVSHKPHTCDRKIDHANAWKRRAHRARRARERLARSWNSMAISEASWFAGESTACGAYIPGGVANKYLPCGTDVRICVSPGDCIVAPVMDRGPYVAGREWDLGEGARDALGCDGVCEVHTEVLRRR